MTKSQGPGQIVAYLTDDFKVAERGHVGMSPCVHRNVTPSIPSRQELTPVLNDVDADHEVSRLDFVLLQERDEGICGLGKQSESGLRQECETDR